MKTLPVLILIIFSFSNIRAYEENWDQVIIERMLSSVSPKTTINVYVEDLKLKKLLETSKIFTLKDNCSEADFTLLSTNREDTQCDKPALVFNFREFRSSPNAIAVFFWQKGRPTIRFSSKRLSHYGLHVRGELVKFVSTKY